VGFERRFYHVSVLGKIRLDLVVRRSRSESVFS
jgi:hypothetical protein